MTHPGTAWPVRLLDRIDSTNEEARRMVRAGTFGPCWIRAREQTAGRGRQGREWASPPGNLHATALFPLAGGYDNALMVPFIAALAVAETADALAPGCRALLKWPNDVRVEGRKLSGILVETGAQGEAVWVAAGIGLNVAGTPATAGQAAISIAELRGDAAVDAGHAMAVLARRFAVRMAAIGGGFASVRTAWLARAEGLGETIRVRSGQGDTYQTGRFEDMAGDGSLILRLPDGSVQTIRAGDVELVRQA